ncbi:MAG: DUF885 family protein [Hyphomonadaceae bacterium]
MTRRNSAYRRARGRCVRRDAPRRVANLVAAETTTTRRRRGAACWRRPSYSRPPSPAVEAARATTSSPPATPRTPRPSRRAQPPGRNAAPAGQRSQRGRRRLETARRRRLAFRQTLKLALGAEMDPHTAHEETALARCHALQAEADTLLRGLGLREGIASRLRTLARDPRYLFSDDDAGKARTVALMQEQLARIRTLLPRAFDGADALPAEVRRLPMPRKPMVRREPARRGLSVDLGRPRPSWTLGSVDHHELLPGHILRSRSSATQRRQRCGPRYASGYGEGWAIYAEQLADELGAFDDDPAALRLGYLQWMLFRLARAVVGFGIHALRWDKPRDRRSARVAGRASRLHRSRGRYRSLPCACSRASPYAAQGLAALHLADLRERTRRAAHGRFTLARFHNAVLRLGPSPAGLEIAAHSEFASA